jgi:hypothetical protein
MNEAINQRLILARQIAPVYIQNPKAQAIAVTGSVARGWADLHSNLEISIFWSETPSEAESQAARESMETLILRPHRNERWLERGELEGIKIELNQILVEMVEQYLAEVIDHYDPAVEKQRLLASIQHGLPLHGASLIEAWQLRAASYPPQLAQAMIRQNLQFNGSWATRETLIERDDLLPLYDLYCQVERQILGILFGLNRLYLSHPNGKWLERLVREMSLCPPALVVRLKQVFRLAPRSGARLLQELLDETLSLVETHMPEIDTAEAREALGKPQQALLK